MSYISGFMMGAAIGKGVRQFLSGGAPTGKKNVTRKAQPFALVSAQSGRRRYRAATISAELASLLEEKIGKLNFVKSVKVNAVTGSILLEYAPENEKKIDFLAAALAQKIFVASAVTSEAKSGEQSGAGAITESVRRSMRDFSSFIKRNTGGIFDAKSLAAALLMLRGIRKMILTKQYPSGSAMLWWAVSLMRGWRTI